jgi:hypothetical protein
MSVSVSVKSNGFQLTDIARTDERFTASTLAIPPLVLAIIAAIAASGVRNG